MSEIMPTGLNFVPSQRTLPDIVPLTIYAPGTPAFGVCTAHDTGGTWVRDYLWSNPDFTDEGWEWTHVTVHKLHVCGKGRRHWRVERATA